MAKAALGTTRRWFNRIGAVVLLGLALVILFVIVFRLGFAATFPDLPRIAHAGGSIDGAVYTNALAAFDRAYSRGFRRIEVDFETTSDGVLVCGHDWDAYGGTPPSAARYFADREQATHQACTMDELFGWLDAHPDAELADAGVTPVILTLYRVSPYWSQAVEIDRFARSGKTVLALTLPAGEALSGLALWAKLRLSDTPVYTHTINACWLGQLLDAIGVDDLYTDELPPLAC
jgi:hypothetical protein